MSRSKFELINKITFGIFCVISVIAAVIMLIDSAKGISIDSCMISYIIISGAELVWLNIGQYFVKENEDGNRRWK